MKFRKIFIGFTGLFLVVFFSTGLTHYQVLNVSRGNDKTKLGIVGDYLYQFSELLFISVQMTRGDVSFLENDNIGDGVVYYLSEEDTFKNYNLLTSYQSNKEYLIELINLQNGESLKKWEIDLNKITSLTKKGDDNSRLEHHSINIIRHPFMLTDSSIIGGTAYSLVRINKYSEIQWVRSDYEAHHSIEQDHENNVWISGRKTIQSLPELVDRDYLDFLDDMIIKIDPKNGNILFERSVIEILKDNNLYDLIWRDGNYQKDPIHLNDVQPALEDGEFWKKGDLLISSRHLSTIFLYRPSDNQILWYKQGPWLNQHDLDFLDESRISVFGNQVFSSGDDSVSSIVNHPYSYNSVFVYDFKNDSISEPYKKFIETSDIKTLTEGRSEILDNGSLFIEETNNGRIFIGNESDKILSFSKRIDSENISMLHWSRIIKN